MKGIPGVVVLAPLACCSPLHAPSASLSMSLASPPSAVAGGGTVSGYMLGSPLGFTSTNGPEIQMHWPGFASGGNPPAGFTPPDFASFLPAVFGANIAKQSPIAAMSMGMEVITIDDTFTLPAGELLDGKQPPADVTLAVLRPGAHGWVALEFTVNEGELTALDDLAPDIGAAKGKGLDASVFSFVVPESSTELLPNELESVCSLSAASMGLPGGTQIHAVDLHTALYYTDLALYDAIFSSRAPDQDACIYFTLRPEIVAANRDELHERLSAEADSATIYMSKWVVTNNVGVWTTPQVYRTAAQLGIPMTRGSTPPKDLKGNILAIDGLSIDAKAPGTIGQDDILFSLAAINDPAPANQIRYTKVPSPPSSPSAPPRRVIAPRRQGGYGSLGLMTRAGAAHGDFCQLDPLLHHDVKGLASSLLSAIVLDDFAIARRLRPDGPYVAPRNGTFVGQGAAPSAKSAPLPDPVKGDAPGVPHLALSVGSYRWTRAEASKGGDYVPIPIVRTCMSWPDFVPVANAAASSSGTTGGAGVGRAWVRYGDISDLAKYMQNPASIPIAWHVTSDIQFTGDPLSQDLDLPRNGLLLPPPNHTAPGADTLRAYAAQWYLEFDHELYTSPLSVLRY